MFVFLFLANPGVAPAQFTCVANGGTITITGYSGSGGAVSIPDTINDLPVAGIGDFAFYNCSNLTNLAFPASLTSIGRGAFDDCSGLFAALFPASVTNIGAYAFEHCLNMIAAYFTGNAPTADSTVFASANNVTVY